MEAFHPTSQAKGTKNKKPESDRILEDLYFSDEDEDSVPSIECDTCSIEFSNMKAYKQHLRGKNHYKMVHKLKVMSKVSKMNKNEKDQAATAEENDEVSDDPNAVHCEVCQISFSGHVPYYSHLKGSIHAKNLKKQKLKNKLKDMPEVLRKDNENEESEDEDLILPKPFARCETCKKEFSGPESFHQHVKSSSHKKKNQIKSVVADIKSKNAYGLENNEDDEENIYECELCEKLFSGPVPYHIHMNSLIHKKEIKKAEMISKIKDFCKPTDDDKVFVCKECEKHFSCPFALKTHLDSNDHEKQKAKKEIKDILDLHKEIALVKAIENTDSEDESSASVFFVCKICHVSLTGPESAKMHVRSKKHIATKKEREVIKNLKSQKAEREANNKEAPTNGVSKQKASSSKGEINDKKFLKADDVISTDIEGFEVI